TVALIASTPEDRAAALKGSTKYSAKGAVAGLNRRAARLTRGAISLSSSNHLPAIVGSERTNPVTLPPGRARLAMKPLPTGVCTEKLNPHILVMKSTKKRMRYDASNPLNRSRDW